MLRIKELNIINFHLPLEVLQGLMPHVKAMTSGNLTDEQQQCMDILQEHGFLHCPSGTSFTFYRISPLDASKVQTSNIDHCLLKDENQPVSKYTITALDEC